MQIIAHTYSLHRYFKLCKKALKTTNSWLLVVVIVVVSVTVVVAASAAECIINIDCGQQIKVKEYKCVFLLMTYSTNNIIKIKRHPKPEQ